MSQIEVLGKRVYVELPEKEESKIIVDENTKEALQKELLKKLQRVTVWAKGSGADPKIEIGQEVLVDPRALTGPGAQIVPFPDGKNRALVMDYDIIHIWK